MKYISAFLIFILLFLNTFKLHAEDALTVKQQLDRIVEEVKDLNKAVFNKSFNKKELYSNEAKNDVERFTSIDIRIYDLENDIKNLTLQFEEILFKLDDLSNIINFLEDDLIEKFENIQINLKKQNVDKNNQLNLKSSEVEEENILGKLIISDKNEEKSINVVSKNSIQEITSNVGSENLIDENEKSKKDKEEEIFNNLSPEETLQFAIDKMMKKNYDKAKEVLENFVIKYSDNQLSGSAHFWLGKIYSFESDYRRAAIVFGEGVQKFPQSIKAAEMYYELAKSLKEMNKIPEACKTLSLLNDKYKGNKFTKDPEKIRDKMICQNEN